MNLRFGPGDLQILSDVTAWSGYFSIRRITLRHRLFSGGWSGELTRELFERGDAVGVLLYDPLRDELVMLEQFRVGAIRDSDSPWMLELVAGIVEAGESDQAVARREAVEEAALEIEEFESIASFFPSAGACSEQVRLFVGKVSSAGAGGVHGCADEGEDIQLHVMSRPEVLELLAAGKITNGHTLIALQWLQIHGEALRQRWL